MSERNAHRALDVHVIDGFQFVRCSCGANPTPHIWVGSDHYGGVQADGWAVLRDVVFAQRVARNLSTPPEAAS